MNTVNVSRGTGWVRVFLSVACFAGVGLGVYLLVVNYGTVKWNLGAVPFYGFLAVSLVTFLAAVVGIVSGVSAVRSPGNAPGWMLNVAMLVLLALTLWTCTAILGARVVLDT